MVKTCRKLSKCVSPASNSPHILLMSMILLVAAGCGIIPDQTRTETPRLNYPNSTLLYTTDDPGVSRLLWSPDGMYLAITYNDNFHGQSSIEIYDMVSQDVIPVLEQVNGSFAVDSWSPDGSSILISGTKTRQYAIWKVDIDNGSTPLQYFADGFMAVWHPAGEYVVFLGDGVLRHDINMFLFDPLSGEMQVIHEFGVETYIDNLSWSLDGRYLMFTMGDASDRGMNIYLLDQSNSELIQLTFDDYYYEPTWSPDGRYIAVQRFENDEDSMVLHIMRVDGSCDTRLFADAYSPAWSPNGTSMAFIGHDGNIYLLDLVEYFGGDIEQGLQCP